MKIDAFLTGKAALVYHRTLSKILPPHVASRAAGAGCRGIGKGIGTRPGSSWSQGAGPAEERKEEGSFSRKYAYYDVFHELVI